MDIDRLPIPNVGNNIFYKEFSVGALLPQIGLSGNGISPGHEYDGVGVITVSDNINVDEDIDDDSLLKSFTEAKRTLVSVIEEKKRSQLPDSSFGIPEDRKYPLDTKKHVESAIRLFSHAEKSKKKELAKRIKVKADEYNIEIPETTQCYKYLQESTIITESKIFNSDDIYYNKDKFDSGEINLCFIIGNSGSGKSTMANKMETPELEKYELDDVASNYNFSDQNLKEYGELIYSFFKGPGKKYRCLSWDEVKEKIKKLDEKNNGDDKKSDDEFWGGLTRDFVKFAISYTKSHKDKKIVIEGVWIVDYMKESDFKDFAVYIKGTSLLISRWRAARRDSQDAPNNLERVKARFKNFTSKKLWESNSEFDSQLKRWQQYFKNK